LVRMTAGRNNKNPTQAAAWMGHPVDPVASNSVEL
jgi:hypothetical protein